MSVQPKVNKKKSKYSHNWLLETHREFIRSYPRGSYLFAQMWPKFHKNAHILIESDPARWEIYKKVIKTLDKKSRAEDPDVRFRADQLTIVKYKQEIINYFTGLAR
jgi:hypothetical protein